VMSHVITVVPIMPEDARVPQISQTGDMVYDIFSCRLIRWNHDTIENPLATAGFTRYEVRALYQPLYESLVQKFFGQSLIKPGYEVGPHVFTAFMSYVKTQACCDGIYSDHAPGEASRVATRVVSSTIYAAIQYCIAMYVEGQRLIKNA